MNIRHLNLLQDHKPHVVDNFEGPQHREKAVGAGQDFATTKNT